MSMVTSGLGVSLKGRKLSCSEWSLHVNTVPNVIKLHTKYSRDNKWYSVAHSPAPTTALAYRMVRRPKKVGLNKGGENAPVEEDCKENIWDFMGCIIFSLAILAE